MVGRHRARVIHKMKWRGGMEGRLFLSSVFLVAISVAWLVPFLCILLYGEHLVREPGRVTLFGELAMFAGFVLFGLVNIKMLISRWRSGK